MMLICNKILLKYFKIFSQKRKNVIYTNDFNF